MWSKDITSLYGKQVFTDFIFEGMDNIIYNMEFEYPYAEPNDMLRFFMYNILNEFMFEGRIESFIVNFTSKRKNEIDEVSLGFSKSFHPKHFYLGDFDYAAAFQNIKMKVKTYNQTGKIIKITPVDNLMCCGWV